MQSEGAGESGSFPLPERADATNAPQLKADLLAYFDQGRAALSGAAVIRADSIGACLLLAAAKEAEMRGLDFTLAEPSPALIDLFARLGLGARLVVWEPI